jgi:hypothetical protein
MSSTTRARHGKSRLWQRLAHDWFAAAWLHAPDPYARLNAREPSLLAWANSMTGRTLSAHVDDRPPAAPARRPKRMAPPWT